MAGKSNRRSRATKRTRTQRSRAREDPGLAGALEEIERVLATPLVELMESEEERAHARELTRQANLAPALARFRELLAFVGEGRRATQAGKLTPTDASALASALGTPGLAAVEVRSMEDLPDVAHLFHWAVAAELLTVRGARILPGHWAEDLQRDPLSAWFKATATLLDHGLLDGFRRGWRKQYVEFLDAGVPFLLSAIRNAGGEVPVAAIEELVWERVAAAYGYQLDDAAERRHVDRLVQGIFAQLADLGAGERIDQDVRLTELGGALAAAASAVIDNDDELLNSSRQPIRRLSPLRARASGTHRHASQPSSSDRFSVAQLTVRRAQSDLLEVDPLDFGPDAPATAALEAERGPQPGDVRQRRD